MNLKKNISFVSTVGRFLKVSYIGMKQDIYDDKILLKLIEIHSNFINPVVIKLFFLL